MEWPFNYIEEESELSEKEQLLALDLHDFIQSTLTLIDITQTKQLNDILEDLVANLNVDFSYYLDIKNKFKLVRGSVGFYIEDTTTNDITAIIFDYEKSTECLTYKDYNATDTEIAYICDDLITYTLGQLKERYQDKALDVLKNASGENL